MEEIEIIDVTLRDGSNVIDFQFDRPTTRGILEGLDAAGVRFIDLGHGLGLGASERSGKRARLTDEEYQLLARDTVRNASWGVLFQAKFGSFEDIERAALCGASFIRVGTDIDKVREGRDFILFAKEKGLLVHACLMKAYAVTIPTYVERAEEVSQWGTDLIVFMDSAGTMTPDLSRRTLEEVVKKVRVPHGFHAHNNLDLAIGNLIAAMEGGATFIDTSLRGLGRSAGNGATEIMSLVLRKMGIGLHLDWKQLQDTATRYIDPLKKGGGIDNLEMVFGYAGFHSGFESILDRVLSRNKEKAVDKRDLILELCRREKINVDERLVAEVLDEML